MQSSFACPQKQTLTQGSGGKSIIWEMVPESRDWRSDTGKEPIQGVFLSRRSLRVTSEDGWGSVSSGSLEDAVKHYHPTRDQGSWVFVQTLSSLGEGRSQGPQPALHAHSACLGCSTFRQRDLGSCLNGGKLPTRDHPILTEGTGGGTTSVCYTPRLCL